MTPTPPPGMPNERAAKKQDNRGTPKKNRKNQQEDFLEIDSSGGSGGKTAIKSPLRMNGGKTEGVKDMMIAPPSSHWFSHDKHNRTECACES